MTATGLMIQECPSKQH